MTPRDRETRYRELFAVSYPAVLAFVRRRYSGDAEAVVAEVFTTAWQRFDALPVDHGAVHAWLCATARNLILNAVRGDARRTALGVRAQEALPRGVAL